MSFEEEFDSIIRRKAEGENYPFDESNWEKTSALLDAERGTSRALKIKQLYLPAVLVFAIGTAGFMTYNYFDTADGSNENTKQIALVATKNSSNNKIEDQLNKKIEGLSKSDNSSKETTHEDKITSTTLNNSEKITAKKSESNNANLSKEEESANSILKPSQLNSSLEKARVKDNYQGNTSKFAKKEEDLSKTKNESGTLPENISKSADQAPLMEESVNAQESLSQANSIASQKENKDSSKKDNDNSYTDNNNVAASSPINEAIVKTSTANFIPPAAASESDLLVNADQLSAVYSTLPFEMTDSDIESTPFVYMERYDDEYYKKKNAKTHYLNLEFGANYLLGWNANTGKDGQGVNWYAGFNYGRYLSSKFNVSIGLQAYNISNMKQPFYLVASKEYGFGSNLVYTRVTNNQMYYVAIPLKFNYAINPNHTIGLGVNAAYLVGATNTVSKYYVLDNEVKNISSSDVNAKGIYKGTNMMNLMLSAHYKTQFGKRIGLNLEFNYGLSDMFKNTELVKTSEKPMGVRVGLTYTIFDK